MRANSFSFWTISSPKAANTGDSSSSSFWISLSASVDEYTLKIRDTRVSARPSVSYLASVLSNVGASLAATSAAISARCRSMPVVTAGLNWSILNLSKRGKPPCAPVHGSSIGLSSTFAKVDDNPMLEPWTGAHGGFPRFDKFKIDQFKPAVTTGMDLQRAEIAALVAAKDAPTFDNTLAKYETLGRALTRVSRIFNVYSSTLADKEIQKLDEELSPVFAAFGDEIVQNEKLFARIKTVHDAKPKLEPEQARLLDYIYR